LQKSIHSLVRNRPTHDRVSNLMFFHTNVNFLGGYGLDAEHLENVQSIVKDPDHDDVVSSDSEGTEADEQTR